MFFDLCYNELNQIFAAAGGGMEFIMRSYLVEFFAEFEYDSLDAEYLLLAYDKIASKADTKALFDATISAYSSDINLDYQKEIHNRARQISDLSCIHPYTCDLLLYICLTKQLKAMYFKRGIDMRIFRDSVLDLKWKLIECKEVCGIKGSFVAPWFSGFFNLTRFALGRLQFEIITSPCSYDKNGIKIEKDVSKVINVHIPRTGTPMDKESCDASYASARAFFKTSRTSEFSASRTRR